MDNRKTTKNDLQNTTQKTKESNMNPTKNRGWTQVPRKGFFVCLMVLNTTFNNISVISWRSVLLVEEPEDLEKTTDLSQVTDKLYHIMLYTSPWSRFKLTTSVVIGTDCKGSCESNYHTITDMRAPNKLDKSYHVKIYYFLRSLKLNLLLICTWWRLFQKHVVYNKLDIYLQHLLAGVVLEYPFKLKEPATYQLYNTNL